MDTLLLDLKYSLRSLRRSPGFTLATVAILGLGIGANAAIFSLVNAVLLRPPAGVQDPGRLVALYTSDFSGPRFGSSSYPDYREFRNRTEAFEGLAAHTLQPVSVSTGSRSERAIAVEATANYFAVLGVR